VTGDPSPGGVAIAQSDQDGRPATSDVNAVLPVAARSGRSTPSSTATTGTRPGPHATTTSSWSAVPVVFTDVVLRRLLFGVILVMTAVVMGVAAAAFFTSFEAIRDFAARSGGIRPEHAWLVPLLVDSFVFISSAADLWFTVTGAARSVDGWPQRMIIWSPKLLLAFAASGSFALNVAHAEPTWAARGVAAIPPMALVLTFEILLAVIRRAAAARITRLGAEQATALGGERPSERPHPNRQSATADRRQATGQEARTATKSPATKTGPGSTTRAAERGQFQERIEAAYLEREIAAGQVLEGKALAREIDGHERRTRRVQEMLRQLRTSPTEAQRARIAAAREAAAISAASEPPALAAVGGERA
jgi:Protein of unknown function (DUF2637)